MEGIGRRCGERGWPRVGSVGEPTSKTAAVNRRSPRGAAERWKELAGGVAERPS